MGLPAAALFFWFTLFCRLGLILNSDLGTTPDPPTQLSIDVQSSKVAVVSWDPPNNSSFSGFNLKVILISLSEPNKEIKNIQTLDQKSTLKDLTPGATYEIQLYSVYKQKESTAYISTYFTTKPNTPGRFQAWFRNETTLLVLWQPPYPAGYYTDYKVSIKPEDSIQSELYVHRESEPPGPAQAVFNGLVPGRGIREEQEAGPGLPLIPCWPGSQTQNLIHCRLLLIISIFTLCHAQLQLTAL